MIVWTLKNYRIYGASRTMFYPPCIVRDFVNLFKKFFISDHRNQMTSEFFKNSAAVSISCKILTGRNEKYQTQLGISVISFFQSDLCLDSRRMTAEFFKNIGILITKFYRHLLLFRKEMKILTSI